MNIIDNPQKEADSLRIHFYRQWGAFFYFYPVTTTIDEMKSSSYLGIIRNDSLRRMLVAHYNFYQNFNEGELLFREATKEVYRLARTHLQNINTDNKDEIIKAIRIPELANSIRTNFANGRLGAIDDALHRCEHLLSELRKYQNSL